MKTPAGVTLSMNSTAKRISVNDGKERLFGAVDENNNGAAQYSRQNSQAVDQQRTGKRILNSGGGSGIGIGGINDTYSNVIGGYPGPGGSMNGDGAS